MIRVENLTRVYNIIEVIDGKQHVVPQVIYQDLSFQVKEGEFAALLGASGCGKSTLLHTIGMLDSIENRRHHMINGQKVSEVESSGHIHIADTDITNLNNDHQAEFINKNIGFIFQLHHLIPELNVLQNVALPLRIGGYSLHEANEKAELLLEEVELLKPVHSAKQRRGILKKYPAVLSGGERQRVAIARALVNSPKVLLADEPTGSLQPDLKKGIMELFLKLNEETDVTILMVTHDESILRGVNGSHLHNIFELITEDDYQKRKSHKKDVSTLFIKRSFS